MCHGADGVGLVGDLRGANEHFTSDDALRAWIEDAPRQKPGTKMPAWKGIIRDEDYAPLMSYVRHARAPRKERLALTRRPWVGACAFARRSYG